MPTASAKTLRNPDEMCQAGLVSPERLAELELVAARYAVSVTPVMADLIDPADPDDPIARQFVPDPRELETSAEELADPIGDHSHSPVDGIVHRYPDRVLLKLTHLCPVYCRFCFRREMVGPNKGLALSDEKLEGALDYVRSHHEIWEVILTGGDPLILSPRRLRAVMTALASIDHVKVVRIHTRVPAVEPARVTAALIMSLKAASKALFVVLHANHPKELTDAARAACARMIDAGFPMLSQSVLLRGVNDNAETLGALMRAFVELRIKPYYLHHGDLAPGTSHFRTSIEQGQTLMRDIHGRLSGLCQPTYVLDIPGGHGKSPIGPSYLTVPNGLSGTRYDVIDYRGHIHAYPPETR